MSRPFRRALVVSAALLGALPLGGCPDFFIGLELGSCSGRIREIDEERSREDAERLVEIAAADPDRRSRLFALRSLKAEHLSPRRGDPDVGRWKIEVRLVRIAEVLDDPDREVASEARALVRQIVGERASIDRMDVAILERQLAPPGDSGPSTAPPSSPRIDPPLDLETARFRAITAARRVYGLARLGHDMRRALPLLRRAIDPTRARRRDDDTIATRELQVVCALAVIASGDDPAAARDELLAALRRFPAPLAAVWIDSTANSRAPWPPPSPPERSLAIDCAIGLGRTGTADPATIRRLTALEGRAELPLRRAASIARARLEARRDVSSAPPDR